MAHHRLFAVLAPPTLALLAAACGADSRDPKTVDVATSASASASSPTPPASSSALVPTSSPGIHCSNGTDRCPDQGVCCVGQRADHSPGFVEWCAPKWTGDAANTPENMRNAITCGNTMPPSVKPEPGLSAHFTPLACVDSSDCKADEICATHDLVEGFEAVCVPRAKPSGDSEICNRGSACRLGGTACAAAPTDPEIVPVRSCYATAESPCGKAPCKDGSCIGTDKGVTCGTPPVEYMVLSCTGGGQCGEAGKCCVIGAQGSSHCAFECDEFNEGVLCATDADCKGATPSTGPKKCKPATGSLAGLKSCQ